MNSINKDIRGKIIKAIEMYPELADDDKALLAEIWFWCGWDERKTLVENLRYVPSSETIRRTRQKLHQEGLITYSKEAEARRYEASKEVREELGQPVVYFDKETNTARLKE